MTTFRYTYNHENCIHVYMSKELDTTDNFPNEHILCVDNTNRTIHYNNSSSFDWYVMGENVKPNEREMAQMNEVDRELCKEMIQKFKADNSNRFPNANEQRDAILDQWNNRKVSYENIMKSLGLTVPQLVQYIKADIIRTTPSVFSSV